MSGQTNRRRSLACGALCMALLVGAILPAAAAPRRQATPLPGPPGPATSVDVAAFADRFFPAQMAQQHVPGCVFILVKDGAVLFRQGYGVTDVTRHTPVTPDGTVFGVASVSKLFVAVAVLQQVEQGRLDLHADVNTYLRTFQIARTYRQPITLAALLTHTDGFEDRNFGAVASGAELQPLGPYLAQQQPQRVRPPGAIYSYSSYGYALAAYIVEQVSGLPFDAYITAHILQPLGLIRSSYRPLPALTPALATPYWPTPDGYQPVTYPNLRAYPAGSFMTTGDDMARFLIALTQDGRYGETRILQAATVQELLRRQFANDPRLPGTAYSFVEADTNGVHALLQGGQGNGIASAVYLLPAQHLGFFIAANTGGPFVFNAFRAFMDQFYPAPAPPPGPTAPLIHESLDRYSGSYIQTRTAHSTLEKVSDLQTLHFDFALEGETLVANGNRFVEVAPLLFHYVGGTPAQNIAFRADAAGHITYLIGPEGEAYVHLAWYERPAFHFALLGFFLLTFLSAVLLWGGGALLRLRHSSGPPPSRRARQARVLAALISGLDLIFLLGVAMVFRTTDIFGFYTGPPAVLVALLGLPLVTTPLALGPPVYTVLAWRAGEGSLVGRLHYTLVALAALGLIPFLLYWNLLGFQY